MMARIEYHPENGDAPHVVITGPRADGAIFWAAYRTLDRAKQHQHAVEAELSRPDGIIEVDDVRGSGWRSQN